MTEFAVSTSAAIAEEWWCTLTAEDPQRRGPRRAALARLRRATTTLEVIQEPEALRLIRRLPKEDPDRVAVLAGVLALVRESDTRPVARAIGRKELDDEASALMAEVRFRRLLQAGHPEIMESMRRLVRLAGRKVNVHGLSTAILRWGDAVKKKWIFEYYNVSEAGDLRDDSAAQPLLPLTTTDRRLSHGRFSSTPSSHSLWPIQPEQGRHRASKKCCLRRDAASARIVPKPEAGVAGIPRVPRPA